MPDLDLGSVLRLTFLFYASFLIFGSQIYSSLLLLISVSNIELMMSGGLLLSQSELRSCPGCWSQCRCRLDHVLGGDVLITIVTMRGFFFSSAFLSSGFM